jgi:AraC family transcriptional regulator
MRETSDAFDGARAKKYRWATSPMSTAPSRVMFASPNVTVGVFRCPPDHPRFGDSGPTREYCFVFPRTAVWIEHEGRPPFVADANVVPLYNAGHPYRRRQIADVGDRTDWFGVSPAILREMLTGLDPAAADDSWRLFRFDFARVAHRTFLKQRAVFTHVRTTDASDALYIEESVIGVLEDVLTRTYGSSSLPHPSRTHRDLTEAAKARLNATSCSQHNLTDLARSIGTSVFHLCRVFRHYAGSTIHRYRNDLRLRQSLERLDGGGEDILSVALTLGYSGHSHFTGAFHQAFGLTPSQFRDASRRTRDTLSAEQDRVSRLAHRTV